MTCLVDPISWMVRISRGEAASVDPQRPRRPSGIGIARGLGVIRRLALCGILRRPSLISDENLLIKSAVEAHVMIIFWHAEVGGQNRLLCPHSQLQGTM